MTTETDLLQEAVELLRLAIETDVNFDAATMFVPMVRAFLAKIDAMPTGEFVKPDVHSALSVLSAAMQTDPDFAWSWHCNVAMTAQDAGAPHDRSNIWAANFMQRAFAVDTLTRTNAMLSASQRHGG